MRRVARFLALAICCVPVAALAQVAQPPRFELVPLAGYRTGGEIVTRGLILAW
jgi:hypothetical protein